MPCVRIRFQIQCVDCGATATDFNRGRERCATCQVEHIKVRVRNQRAERKAWANQNNVAVEDREENRGRMEEGERLCVECLKIKPVQAFRRNECTCTGCRDVPAPKLAETMAEAEGMG